MCKGKQAIPEDTHYLRFALIQFILYAIKCIKSTDRMFQCQ